MNDSPLGQECARVNEPTSIGTLELEGETKPVVVVTVVRGVVIAVGYACVTRVVVPVAAAQHAILA